MYIHDEIQRGDGFVGLFFLFVFFGRRTWNNRMGTTLVGQFRYAENETENEKSERIVSNVLASSTIVLFVG